MYAIVKAEKGSYDSNINVSVLSRHMKKPLAVDALKNLLVDEILTSMCDLDLTKFSSVLHDENLLREAVLKDLEDKLSVREPKYEFENGDYLILKYNRAKIFSEYVFPCSSLNEYIAKTISIISFQ